VPSPDFALATGFSVLFLTQYSADSKKNCLYSRTVEQMREGHTPVMGIVS
jgi:hypothetical protein